MASLKCLVRRISITSVLLVLVLATFCWVRIAWSVMGRGGDPLFRTGNATGPVTPMGSLNGYLAFKNDDCLALDPQFVSD